MRKIYLGAVFSLLLFAARSQNFSWAVKGGLFAYDYGYGITTDNSGNVYVAGKYEDSAMFSGIKLPCAGNHDSFLAKYDAAGAISWVRTSGGKLGDYVHGMSCDGSNNVYVAGEIEWATPNLITFPGSAITLTPIGGNDAYVAKYDLSGTLQWAKSAGGGGNDKALAVSSDNAGNVFITGFFTDTAWFNGTQITGYGAEDIYLAKYDANGNFLWVKKAGSPGRDEPKSMKCDAAGNVYVCGFYSNGANFSGQIMSSPGVYYEAYLAKYDNNGNLLWIRTGGGNYDDVAWSLTMDNAGKIFVSGEFNASAFFGSTQLITAGNADVFVACYDAAGNAQWAKRAGGALIDRARGMGCDGTNLFITGQFGNSASFGANTLNAADSSDIFFASLDNSGNFLKALSVGGVADAYENLGYESGIAICAEASGNVYATGAMLDGGVFGSTTLTPYTRTDVFVTKISQMVGIENYAGITHAEGLYPNPSNGNFVIEFNKAVNERTETVVYNNLGAVVSKRSDSNFSKIEIDLGSEDNGIYMVEMRTADRSLLRQKIVVQK